jgi:hypothetical protein
MPGSTVQPDYGGGGLANLMCSLIDGLGGPSPVQPPLDALPATRIGEARNVVLLLVDGMGLDLFERHAGPLARHLAGSMTSVFPSSTAPAITTLLTGVTPSRHAATGWYMHFPELGTIGMILPFRARWGGDTFDQAGVDPAMLLGAPGLFDALPVRSVLLLPRDLADSPYSRALGGGAERHGFDTFGDCLNRITRIVRSGPERKYLYAYWPWLDALAHGHGIGSPAVRQHFGELESAMAAWWDTLSGTETLVLVTADHGFVDTSPAETVWVHRHPPLAGALSQPLTGEPRVAYCHVRPGYASAFRDYVESDLATAFELHESESLLADGWFGPGTPDPRVRDRIGDYTLIARGRHVIRDQLCNCGAVHHIGVHGGISGEEMLVPLVAVEA